VLPLREDTAIVLGGVSAHEALAQVCNVNFGALELTQRPVVMTLMVGVGVLVLPQYSQEDGRVYRIWCDPGFGPYLWETLEEVVQKIPGRSP
jgi:sarcosine oxidase gamma subunit